MSNQYSTPSQRSIRLVWGLLALVVVVIIIGVATGFETDTNASSEEQKNAADPGPELAALDRRACRDFRSLMADLDAGILNDAEMRSGLQEIYRDVEYSDHRALRTGAQGMLRAFTQGPLDNMADSAQIFSDECRKHGH